MASRYSRRQFLARAMSLALVPTTLKPSAIQGPAPDPATGFGAGDLETLVASMDEIIPGTDGMPPASMGGGPHYLEYLGWQYPAIQEEISRFLTMLAQASAVTFREEFRKLRPDQRGQVLSAMEENHPTTFSSFVGYVYESYYTNPKVIGLISCSPSPLATEDEEALLKPVRKLTHMYREVP